MTNQYVILDVLGATVASGETLTDAIRALKIGDVDSSLTIFDSIEDVEYKICWPISNYKTVILLDTDNNRRGVKLR